MKWYYSAKGQHMLLVTQHTKTGTNGTFKTQFQRSFTNLQFTFLL